MGALCIRVTDVKNEKVIIDGIENVDSAKLILPSIIRKVYEDWRREPNQDDHSTIATMSIDYLGIRYDFIDFYWD